MPISNQNILFKLVIAIFCLIAMTMQSHANPVKTENSTKAAPVEKDRLVLMPLRVDEDDKGLQGSMETALVEGLQEKYTVFSGEQVAQKAHLIFMKESKNTAHTECDETRCMQNIAGAFQSELIATANVSKQDGSYFLALSVQNIFDSKVVYSKSLTCKSCDATQVVEQLKVLGGKVASVTVVNPGPTTKPVSQAANFKDEDTALWAIAQKRNLPEDYRLYLDTYPNGKYASLALARLNTLRQANAGKQFVYLNNTNPNQGQNNLQDKTFTAACRTDTQRYCRGVKPGGGRIIACLKENADSLTASCYASLTNKLNNQGVRKDRNNNAQGGRSNSLKDCNEDTKRLCHGVQLGGGRIIACLQTNSTYLSSSCAAALAAKGNRQ